MCVCVCLSRLVKAKGASCWAVGTKAHLHFIAYHSQFYTQIHTQTHLTLLFLLVSAYSYNNNSNAAANGNTANIVPKNDKNAIMQNIANSYRTEASNNSSVAAVNWLGPLPKRRRTKSRTKSRDCRVSHWSEWSACSKTCGIGEMHRYRKVIRHGKRGGRPCPALQESKWCGTEKGCHSPATYFNW